MLLKIIKYIYLKYHKLIVYSYDTLIKQFNYNLKIKKYKIPSKIREIERDHSRTVEGRRDRGVSRVRVKVQNTSKQ